MQGDKERLEEHINRLSDELRRLEEERESQVKKAYRTGYSHGWRDGRANPYPTDGTSEG